MNKTHFSVGAVVMGSVLLSLALTMLCYAPTQMVADSGAFGLIDLAGTEIRVESAPIWRLCAMEGIGPSRAQQLAREYRM